MASISSETYYGKSTRILRTLAGMIPHLGVSQRTMENIDTRDMMTPTVAIQPMNEIAPARLNDSRDTTREAQIDSESFCAVVTTGHAQKSIMLQI